MLASIHIVMRRKGVSCCSRTDLIAVSPGEVLSSDVLVGVLDALLQRRHVRPVLPVLLPEDPGVDTGCCQGYRDTAIVKSRVSLPFFSLFGLEWPWPWCLSSCLLLCVFDFLLLRLITPPKMMYPDLLLFPVPPIFAAIICRSRETDGGPQHQVGESGVMSYKREIFFQSAAQTTSVSQSPRPMFILHRRILPRHPIGFLTGGLSSVLLDGLALLDEGVLPGGSGRGGRAHEPALDGGRADEPRGGSQELALSEHLGVLLCSWSGESVRVVDERCLSGEVEGPELRSYP